MSTLKVDNVQSKSGTSIKLVGEATVGTDVKLFASGAYSNLALLPGNMASTLSTKVSLVGGDLVIYGAIRGTNTSMSGYDPNAMDLVLYGASNYQFGNFHSFWGGGNNSGVAETGQDISFFVSGSAATAQGSFPQLPTSNVASFSGDLVVTGAIRGTNPGGPSGDSFDLLFYGDKINHFNDVSAFYPKNSPPAPLGQDLIMFVTGTASSWTGPMGAINLSTIANTNICGDLVLSGALIGRHPGGGGNLDLTLYGSSINGHANIHGFYGKDKPSEQLGQDINFFVSGSKGSKDTPMYADVGTSVFGGDVTVSGSLHIMTGSVVQGLFMTSPNGTRFRVMVADDGALSASPLS